MSAYTIIDATGEVLSTINVPDAEHLAANIPQGASALPGNPPNWSSYYVAATSSWTQKPAPPGPWAQWDKVNKVWTDPRTLSQIQAVQVAKLQAAYLAAINTPVSFTNAAGVATTYPAGNTLALNGATSTQNLNECIAAGAAAWTLGHWLDTGNVAQAFTYADLQSLAAAMEAQEVYDWTDLVGKVAQVQAATTSEAVQAINF